MKTQLKHTRSFFALLFIGVALATFGNNAHALSALSQQTINAYRNLKELSGVSIIVPTVVEIPFEESGLERSHFAVLDETTDTFQPYFFREEVLVDEIAVSASALGLTGAESAKMIDRNLRSYTDFILPENAQGRAQITLAASRPITSSSLTLLLENHVALPTSIEIRAQVTGAQRIVVAKRSITQTTISFPRISSSQWTVILTYAQPLRISELKFNQENATKISSRALRFLAQPDHRYQIYFNPDRYVSPAVGEAGNLADDKDMLRLSSPPLRQNVYYRQADIDADGVPDILDNCVSMANQDQLDINTNGRGDVCDDFDRDAIVNSQDNCPNDPNRGQVDIDGDGIGDACDTEESRITERHAWIPWVGIAFAALTLIILFALTARSMMQKRNDRQPPTGQP